MTQPFIKEKAKDSWNIMACSPQELKAKLDFSYEGLASAEATRRLGQYGYNEIAREKPLSPFKRLLNHLKNPLVILLAILGIVSRATGDLRATIVIFVMVLLGIVLRYFQEMRADK